MDSGMDSGMTRQRPHCPECGSAEVYVDAFAAWDDERQEWSLANTYEAMTCGECSYEFKEADWRDIE